MQSPDSDSTPSPSLLPSPLMHPTIFRGDFTPTSTPSPSHHGLGLFSRRPPRHLRTGSMTPYHSSDGQDSPLRLVSSLVVGAEEEGVKRDDIGDEDEVDRVSIESFGQNLDRVGIVGEDGTDTSDTGLLLDAESVGVLRCASLVNGKVFSPLFLEEWRTPGRSGGGDLEEEEGEATPIPTKKGEGESESEGEGEGELFCDDWVPELCEAQRRHFAAWKRPFEFVPEGRTPVVFACLPPNPDLILQSMVGDCSFLASLIVAATYERRFPSSSSNSPVVSNLIFPQQYSAHSGKFLVRLFFNGTWRRVVVDDRFPVDAKNNLLCGHSANPAELWVSILEKAFVKVKAAGYNIEASLNRLELHCLAGGWPSSTVDLEERGKRRVRAAVNVAATWKEIHEAFESGECMITATANEPRAGIRGRHAYALVDIPEIVQGNRLLLLRNPWGEGGRWIGKFSPFSPESWNAEMREKLGYWPEIAAANDDGCFFISIEDFCTNFDRVDFAWNPKKRFPYHSRSIHRLWKREEEEDGVPEALYPSRNLGRNPQFKLTVRGQGKIWICLDRHGLMGTLADESKNAPMACFVYPTEGRLVRQRRPHVNKAPVSFSRYPLLLELDDLLQKGKEESVYTLVVQQLEDPYREDPFVLSIHSSAPVELQPLPLPPAPMKVLSGRWEGPTAGGNMQGENWASYCKNPQFSLLVMKPTEVTLVLEPGLSETSVSIDLFGIGGARLSPELRFEPVGGSLQYSPGCTAFSSRIAAVGVYTCVVSTYDRDVQDEFRLSLEGTADEVDLWELGESATTAESDDDAFVSPCVPPDSELEVNGPVVITEDYVSRDLTLRIRQKPADAPFELVIVPESDVDELKGILSAILPNAPSADHMVLRARGIEVHFWDKLLYEFPTLADDGVDVFIEKRD